MAQDLNSLIKDLQELTQAARQPGRMSYADLEREAKRIMVAAREVISNLKATQLPQNTSPVILSAMEAFQTQLMAILHQNNPEAAAEKSEEMKKLAEDLTSIKRGFIQG